MTALAHRVIDAARSPDLRRVEAILASFREDPIRFSLLTDAILVAFADEKLAAGETEQIAEFADALGITTPQAVAIARYVDRTVSILRISARTAPRSGVRWLYRKLTGGRGVL